MQAGSAPARPSDSPPRTRRPATATAVLDASSECRPSGHERRTWTQCHRPALERSPVALAQLTSVSLSLCKELRQAATRGLVVDFVSRRRAHLGEGRCALATLPASFSLDPRRAELSDGCHSVCRAPCLPIVAYLTSLKAGVPLFCAANPYNETRHPLAWPPPA